MTRPILKLIAGWGLALAFAPSAFAVSVGIPMHELGVPASDLTSQGHEIDRDEAVDLARKGTDLSTLAPKTSDAWKGQTLPLTNADEWRYPAEGATVHFDSYMGSTERVMRSRVIEQTGATIQPFQLLISIRAHQALTLAALLRKLGYPIASPRIYKSLTVAFASTSERDRFLNQIADKNQACRGRWLKYSPANAGEAEIISKDPCAKADLLKLGDSKQVTFQDVVLEPAQINTWMYHWGVMSSDHLKGRRALRALLLPLVFADIPESINLYSFEVGHVLTNTLILTHPYADQWREATYADLKWIARKIAALSRSDIEAIIAQGEYPSDVSKLIAEKMIGRQKQLTDLFELKSDITYKYKAALNVGAVKKGKLTQEWYEGYAQRFAYQDPESPLRTDEIARYFLLNTISSGVSKLVDKVNNALSLNSTNDIALGHLNDLRQACMDEYAQHGFCTRPIGYWGGPVAGASITADRSVITGNLYGGDAKVQLVDNVGVSAMVGLFASKDGLPKIGGTPLNAGLYANLQVQRNYVHVRPVLSMKQALKDNWGNLLVPKFMKNLARTLDAETSTDPEIKRPEDFFPDLKEGEMFIITDSIAAGAQAQVGLPLTAILDFAIMGASPQISASMGTQRAIIRRTTITRTSDGIQVYLQRINTGSFNWRLDFNWWVNVARYSQTTRHSTASSKAFLMGKVEEADRGKAAVALKALLKSNNSEMLEGEFGYYALDHVVDAKVNEGRFLRWQWYALEESHLLKIQPPRDPEGKFNPADHERTLFSHRLVTTNGTNDSMQLSEVINQYTPGWNVLPNSGHNPANAFFGKGHWKVWQTEAEITPGHESRPVTTLENHWGGWKLPRANLLKILDGIETKVQPLNLDRPIMRHADFQMVRELQFYEIISKIIIYQDGMENLRRFFFPGLLASSVDESNHLMHQRLIGLELSDGGPTLAKFAQTCWQNRLPNLTPDLRATWLPGRGPGPIPPGSYIGDLPEGVWFQKDRAGNHNLHADPNYYCVKPWMKFILDNYTKAPKEIKTQVAWQTRYIKRLEQSIPLPKLLKLIGKDNYLLQVRISGFSGTDSTLNDENGFLNYMSDTIGTLDERDGTGIFSEFSNDYGISAHELNARYLSEGF